MADDRDPPHPAAATPNRRRAALSEKTGVLPDGQPDRDPDLDEDGLPRPAGARTDWERGVHTDD